MEHENKQSITKNADKRWGALIGILINTTFKIHCINFKSVTKV